MISNLIISPKWSDAFTVSEKLTLPGDPVLLKNDMKVITFSRKFPGYHPKRGQRTLFVEQILRSAENIWSSIEELNHEALSNGKLTVADIRKFVRELNPYIIDAEPQKIHTCRSGGPRFAPGEMASLRVWSDLPRKSPQIAFAEVRIQEVHSLHIVDRLHPDFEINGKSVSEDQRHKLAENDGLLYEDFLAWMKYPEPFTGSIYAWDKTGY